MCCFNIKLFLEDKTWSTKNNIPENDRNIDTSTDWTKLSLNFTDENYGIKIIYDQKIVPMLICALVKL